MKTKSKWLILAGVLVAAVLFLAFVLNRGIPAQHFTAKVERGDIHDVVEATGTINAVITVQVGSQVSGTIAKLFVDFNSRVHKGDIVALIDPALLKGAVQQASADLENAKANLVAARANLEKAKAGLVQTKADYDRTVGLTKSGILSRGGRHGPRRRRRRDTGEGASDAEGGRRVGREDESQLYGDSLAD